MKSVTFYFSQTGHFWLEPGRCCTRNSTRSSSELNFKNMFSVVVKKRCLWFYKKQECIPVGCVPAERWPYSENWRPPPKIWSRHPPRKFGAGTPPKIWSRHPPRKFGAGTPPPENLEQAPPLKIWSTPPPVNRITHTCKNITLAKTSFRPVIISSRHYLRWYYFGENPRQSLF